MKGNTSRVIVTLGVGAALALPSAAFASHGADDSAGATPEHAGVVDDSHGGTNQVEGVQEPAGEGAQDPQPVRTQSYDLRGTVVSVDAASSTLVMQIQKANHGRRGRALRGQSVTIDLAAARMQVADANGDGVRDINDVAAGDRAEARVRLPRSQSPDLTQAVAAQRFKDRAARPSDDPANHS